LIFFQKINKKKKINIFQISDNILSDQIRIYPKDLLISDTETTSNPN